MSKLSLSRDSWNQQPTNIVYIKIKTIHQSIEVEIGVTNRAVFTFHYVILFGFVFVLEVAFGFGFGILYFPLCEHSLVLPQLLISSSHTLLFLLLQQINVQIIVQKEVCVHCSTRSSSSTYEAEYITNPSSDVQTNPSKEMCVFGVEQRKPHSNDGCTHQAVEGGQWMDA